MEKIIELTATATLGATFTLIGIFITNRQQQKRDKLNHLHIERIESDRHKFEENKIFRTYIKNEIKKIYYLISSIQNNVSLTSSVIDSSEDLSVTEYDAKYKKEAESFMELESIINTEFPEFHEKILKLKGIHNKYWGTQRLLLMQDIKNAEPFFSIQKEVIKIEDFFQEQISILKGELMKRTETI